MHQSFESDAARRARFLAAGICPDSGERLTLLDLDRGFPAGSRWGKRFMCPGCDCFGYPVNGETGGPME